MISQKRKGLDMVMVSLLPVEKFAWVAKPKSKTSAISTQDQYTDDEKT